VDANQAVSFFAYIDGNAANAQSLSLDNNKTQEKLVIKVIGPSLTRRGNYVTISRYPMGAKEEWIKEMGIPVQDEYKRKYYEFGEKKIVVDLNSRNIKSGYFTCSLF
jgi:hypothetical protein